MSELLEKILSKDNMNAVYKRVCANKGVGGVDDVTVEELGDYIKENWESIREQIRRSEYKPQPVRRVKISKSNGGLDSEEAWAEGKHGQDPHRKATEAEIPWIRILQGQQGKRMEMQATSGLCEEI